MTKRIVLILLTLCIHLNFLEAQSPQYENKIIEKVDIIFSTPSAEETDSKTVTSQMKTAEGRLFSQVEFDNDLKTLSKTFDRVDPSINMVDQKIFITLKVWLKPTIRTIRWEGNDRMKGSALQKELEVTPGTVFDRQSFTKCFHKLKALYIKKGFFEASLDYEVEPDPCTNEIDICIKVCEGRAGKIKEIVFEGFNSCEETDILELMVTKKYCIFTSWLSNEGIYHEDAVQQDQFMILNYLQNEGYADAHVDIEVCESKQSNRIIVIIRANRGPMYNLGKITFEGNTLFCDEDLLQQFTIFEGAHYSPEEIRNTAQSIMALYGRRGYIECVVNHEPKLTCEGYAYDINLTIEEGDQYRVGLIKVFGNCATQTNVILHETLLIPGEIFNSEKLEKTEERLENIGFFKNVNVYAVKSEDESCLGGNYRDVHIEVEETSTGHFGAFFGFSTVESIFGGFNITERNFNYRGLGCFWREGYSALRGGGEYAHFTATIGKKSRSYVFSWTKPFWMDTQWSVGFDLEKSSNRYISSDYDIEAQGITLHATYQVNPFLATGWHYRARDTHVNINGDASCELRREAKHAGFVSAIGTTVVYDSTDHPSRPTRGIKSRLEGEMAGVGGITHFFSFAYLNTAYYQTDRDGVFKLRADMRFVVPFHRTNRSTVPLDERLFLGGDNQLRGYRAYKIGPSADGDPKGGLSMQYISLEYDRRLMKRLDGFLFCDIGHLSGHNFDFWGRYYTSVGFGFKLKILDSAPPLNFGFGFPLNPKRRGEVKKFFLTVGGKF